MLKMLARIASGLGVLSLVLSGSSVIAGAQPQTQAKSSSPSLQQNPSNRQVNTGPARAKLKNKKQKGKKEVVEAPPPPPPPPPTPEQLPAQTPEVVYAGGLLTISAPNSTMNDVLAAVRRVTGATIEKPPLGGSDRVVVHLGPGQPKDVLSALFNGSRYDYIILGPTGQPGAVQRIILTAKSSAPQTLVAGAPGRPAPNQPPAGQQEQQDNGADTEDMTVPEQNAPEPEQQPQEQPEEQPQQTAPQPAYPQPVSPEQQPQAQPPQGQEEQGQQPHVKSPEELLRELQQMQQQQQQNQNQQNQQQPPQ